MAAASCPETGGLASFSINLQFDRKRRNIRNRVNGGRSSELGNRLFVEAVIWKFRSGAPWRDLPKRFRDCKNIHKRFSRWAASGVWESLFKTLADDPDNEYAMIDATIVRAHQHGAGPKPVSRLCLGVLDAADVNRSFLMKPGLFDHFRPFAIVNLELFGERGAAATEHDAAFRLHAFDDCRRLERRIARLIEARHDVGRRAGGLCLPQIKPEAIGDAGHPGLG